MTTWLQQFGAVSPRAPVLWHSCLARSRPALLCRPIWLLCPEDTLMNLNQLPAIAQDSSLQPEIIIQMKPVNCYHEHGYGRVTINLYRQYSSLIKDSEKEKLCKHASLYAGHIHGDYCKYGHCERVHFRGEKTNIWSLQSWRLCVMISILMHCECVHV